MTFKVSIHQPNFMPWLGYFDKMARSDTWIHLADVQFMRDEWQHRQQFRHWNKDRYWLTVPLSKSQYHHGQTIREVKIGQLNKGDWRQVHLESLTRSYGHAPYWERVLPFLVEQAKADWPDLLGLNLYTIRWLRYLFGITCPMVDAPALGRWGHLRGSALLLNLCRQIGATTYLSGPDGRQYLDLPAFEAAGIKVEFQEFNHPVYSQVHGEPFVSHLSALDLIVNHQDPCSVLKGAADAQCS